MPCELKGFRGLDISKGVFWFSRKPFWVRFGPLLPKRHFRVPAQICLRAAASQRAGTGLCFGIQCTLTVCWSLLAICSASTLLSTRRNRSSLPPSLPLPPSLLFYFSFNFVKPGTAGVSPPERAGPGACGFPFCLLPPHSPVPRTGMPTPPTISRASSLATTQSIFAINICGRRHSPGGSRRRTCPQE